VALLRPAVPDDSEEIARLLCENHEFMAPFEPLRDERFFTSEVQRERIEANSPGSFAIIVDWRDSRQRVRARARRGARPQRQRTVPNRPKVNRAGSRMAPIRGSYVQARRLGLTRSGRLPLAED
jgi:hypothetical protein